MVSETSHITSHHITWHRMASIAAHHIRHMHIVSSSHCMCSCLSHVGVVHLVDNLLIPASFLSELRSLRTSPPYTSPPCINGTSLCHIHNISTSHHMMTWHNRTYVDVCYNTTTHVCINETYLCPVEAPLLCQG